MSESVENNIKFKSVFAKYLYAYYEERVSLGYTSKDRLMYLAVFDRYFYDISYDSIIVTKSVYEEMMNYLSSVECKDIAKYSNMFSHFLQYMARLGNPNYIPPIIPIKNQSNFIPYIFTQEEILRIFKAADKYKLKRSNGNCCLIAIPAIIRTLYSTAIRLGEALSLLNEDIDFERHTLRIKHTKNRCQRIAPINESLEQVLRQYIYYRNKLGVIGINNNTSPFFVNASGNRIDNQCVHYYFVQILYKAEIPYKGNHEGPRIHDLRHTACVHAMEKMVKDGKDIYCTLPYLAAYMGHKSLHSTEGYLRLTLAMHPEIIKASDTITNIINPSVYDDVIFDNYDE
jgi:integrase